MLYSILANVMYTCTSLYRRGVTHISYMYSNAVTCENKKKHKMNEKHNIVFITDVAEGP